MHQSVASAASQPSGDHSQNNSRLTTANTPTNGRPSRWTGASWERMEARTDMITPPRPRARRVAVGRGDFVVDQRQFFARRRGLALPVPHAGIEAALRHQLMVIAAPDDH